MFIILADNIKVAETTTAEMAIDHARRHLELGAVVRILTPDGARIRVTL